MSRATLFVNFQQEGFHQWSSAPDAKEYIRHRHRHLFHIRVELSAPADNERSVEFHDLLHRSQTIFRDIAVRTANYDYGDWSCEKIAEVMSQRLCNVYHTMICVSVSEDGECGAIVYCDPDDQEQDRADSE